MPDTDLGDVAWKAAGATASRTFSNRYKDVVSVKEFGALGDGVNDDRPNIQTALDELFPNSVSDGVDSYALGSLYFPPGDYRCSTYTSNSLVKSQFVYDNGGPDIGVLIVNEQGSRANLINVHMFGDNSATTRIFYDGPTVTPASRRNTVLLNLDVAVREARFEGLHFDMSPCTSPSGDYPTGDFLQGATGASICVWNRGRPVNPSGFTNAGHNNIWADIKCTGGTYGIAMSGEGAALGSENIFLFCKLENNGWGLVTFSANALGYNVLGGYCKNNAYGGIIGSGGVIGTITGVEFAGNGGNTEFGISGNRLGDVYSGNGNPMLVNGCNSTSTDFICENGVALCLTGNYHHSANPGHFYAFSGSGRCCMNGNYSTNGDIKVIDHSSGIYFRANRFDRSDYLAASWFITPNVEGIKEPPVSPFDPDY